MKNPSARDLAIQAQRSAAFVLVARSTTMAANLLQQIIVARILAPEHFGLMGICLLAISVATVLTETGLLSALIYRQEIGRTELDTFWSIGILRGVALVILLWLFSGSIGRFFGASDAVEPLRALSLVFLINGLSNPATILLRRDLGYGGIAAQQMVGVITSLLISVILAVLLHNVWALVIAELFSATARCVASFVIYPFLPKFHLDWMIIRESAGYSNWMRINYILSFLVTQGDDILVGRLLQPYALGLYRQAYNVSHLFAEAMTAVASEVGFPLFAKVRSTGNVGITYARMLQSIALLGIPTSGGVAVLSPHAVPIVLGAQWLPIVTPLQILAVSAVLRTILENANSLFKAIGRPDLQTKFSLLRIVTMVILMFPFAKLYGIEGAALGVLTSDVAVAPFIASSTIRLSGCGLASYIRAILIPTINTLIMIVALLLLQRFAIDNPSLLGLVSQICIGMFIYLSLTAICGKLMHYDAAQLLWKLARAHSRLRGGTLG